MMAKKLFLPLMMFFLSLQAQDFNIIDHGFAKEIQIDFPKPEIYEIDYLGSKFSVISVRNSENFSYLPDLTPFYNFLLNASQDVKVDLISVEFDEVELQSPLLKINERSFPDMKEFEFRFDVADRVFDFSYLGKARGVDLASLKVYAFQPSGEKLRYIKKAVFNLNGSLISKVELNKIFAEPKINHLDLNFNIKEPSKEYEYKLYISRDGVYKVTYEDLKRLGIDLKGVDATKLRLKNNGVEIPIYVYSGGDGIFNEGDYIEFYAEAKRNEFASGKPDLYKDVFTDVNVYFLEVADNPGLRFAEEIGSKISNDYIDLRGASFESLLHFEDDVVFERLKYSDVDKNYDERDHWFWAMLESNQQKSFEVHMPAPDPLSLQNIRMRVAFHGVTSTPQLNPEHIANVFINDRRILTTSWNGQTIKIASTDETGYIVPNNILSERGKNTITVFNASEGKIANTIFAVNWFEVQYRRLYQADKDEIKFKIPSEYRSGYFRFELTNFKNPNISIYKIGVSKISNVEVSKAKDEKLGENYHAVFYASVPSNDVEFIAVSENAKLKPDSIAKDLKTNLKNPVNAFDYLIITHPAFFNKESDTQNQNHPLNLLKKLYESKGLSVAIISIDDIYDEFNYGVKSPYALKEFLKYAYYNWTKVPSFILFAGGAVYDKRYSKLDFIPTMYYQSYNWGATSADMWFALIDDDMLADFLIGRLPVRNIEELQNVVEKIISYHNQQTQRWHRNVLMIAGEGKEFENQTDFLVKNVLPKFFNINRLYVVPGSVFSGGTSKLIDYFNEGQVLINFVGHGGGAIWADNGLLKNEDIPKLSNLGRYPFVTSMTCFSGAFDYPGKTAIGVNLITEKDKGAIGVLASSGLGWLLNDYFMILSIFPNAFDEGKTIGEILALGKARYYANYFFWPQAKTMVYQYNYIGDPGIILPVPSQTAKVNLEKQILASNDTLKVQITSQIQSGTALIYISDAEHVTKIERTLNIQSGAINLSISNPGLGSGFVKAFIFDGVKSEAGFTDFKSSGSVIGDYLVFPANPKPGDSLSFAGKVELESQRQPDSVLFVVHKRKSISGRFDRLVKTDTLQCFKTGVNFYTSKKIFAEVGIKYSFKLIAYSSGQIWEGEMKEIIIGGLPDPSFNQKIVSDFQSPAFMRNSSISFVHDSTVKISARIFNLSDVRAENFLLRFYNGAKYPDRKIAETRFSLEPNSSALVFAPLLVDLNPGTYTIVASIESDSVSGDDLDYSNNIAFNELKYNFIKFSSDSVSISPALSIRRINNVSSTAQVIIFEYPVDVKISTLVSDLRNVRLLGERQPFVFKFVSPASVRIYARINLNDTLIAQNTARIKLYRYDEKLRTFISVSGSLNDDWFSADVESSGIYTIGFSLDDKAPRIQISVEGQSFKNGSHVPSNPTFSVLIEDDNGVDISVGSLKFQIDGRDVEHSQITIPDTILNPKTLFVKFSPKLSDGEHTASFMARDINGNWSEKVEINFRVQSKFEVRIYGNYPNPFSERTFFAYEIFGSPVEEVEFKIYTVAGRLIRKLRYPSMEPGEVFGFQVGGTGVPTSIGYHEIWWDGTDTDGREVANGVYFYKFLIKRDGKIESHTGKIARIR